MMAKRKNKNPARKENPPFQKRPQSDPGVLPSEEKGIAWHFEFLDRYGPFGWDNATKEALWVQIRPMLSKLEKLSWPEIFMHPKNHPIKKHNLSPEAQERLEEIEKNDIDEVISLGITKLSRVLGIRNHNILKILWCDPNHKACLSKKQNT